MFNPLENLWPLLVIGSILTIAAAVGWIKTGQRWALAVAALLMVLTIGSVLGSLWFETDPGSGRPRGVRSRPRRPQQRC